MVNHLLKLKKEIFQVLNDSQQLFEISKQYTKAKKTKKLKVHIKQIIKQ